MTRKIVNSIENNWRKLVFISLALFTPVVSFAQITIDNTGNSSNGGKIVNPIKTDSLAGLIKTLLEGVLKIGIPIVALAIIYCGFLFVSARGNPEEIKHAKESLLYTLIGAAVLLGSWALATLISNTVLAL